MAAGSPNNCDAPISSQGNNLENANSCGLAAAGDKINVNPQTGSAAKQRRRDVDACAAGRAARPSIAARTAAAQATDQRGVARPIDGNHDGNAVCDIGAYEAPTMWQVFLPLVKR